VETRKPHIQTTDGETSQTLQKASLLRIEQVGLIYKQSFLTLLGAIGVLLYFAYVLKEQDDPVWLSHWLGATLFIYLLRIGLSFFYLRSSIASRTRHLAIWKNSFLSGSLLAGCAWGTGCVLLMPTSPLHQAFIVVVVGGVCADDSFCLAICRYVVCITRNITAGRVFLFTWGCSVCWCQHTYYSFYRADFCRVRLSL